MFKGLRKILTAFLAQNSSCPLKVTESFFNSVEVKEKAPSNEEIHDKTFIKVVYNQESYWCLFRCPCGCRRVISLSLQQNHKPHWKIIVSESGKPSLFPSVWQNQGCKSHFWIEDGEIRWCKNTGMEPWIAVK
ncbi:hypothetical protein FK178_15075 [Antarcticibacterium arcticum]|uniref:Uncharacterized protein n=1 Tax=Antarcticibacterium arcticum TaxID=2585771 RepID=A0A5B8YPX5_9FLAO|nr:DUF6527 family protein [Antarcticibacterium arcticum]QED38957.1 hypothetical protein FK178_15075 [Antarcticibacterium arcticum]